MTETFRSARFLISKISSKRSLSHAVHVAKTRLLLKYVQEKSSNYRTTRGAALGVSCELKVVMMMCVHAFFAWARKCQNKKFLMNINSHALI